MRTGVLVVALIFMLNDWGGQRTPARSATIGTEYSSLSFAAASTNAASSESEIRNAGLAGQPNWGANSNSRVDFDSQIKPILQSKCMPCHFSGGAQYEKLPFDRPDTIKKLGTKLFTRIQDENHRRLIREFLAQ